MNYIRKKNYNNLIKSVLLSTAMLIALIPFGILIFKFNFRFISTHMLGLDFNSINFILAVISIPCCVLYYYLYKNKEFFILTLSYVSIDLEYFFINVFLLQTNPYYSDVSNMILAPFLIRVFLLTIAILQDSKITAKILSNKKRSIICATIFNILGVFFEMHLRKSNIPFFSSTTMDLINLLAIIYYFYLLYLLAQRCILKSEFMYTIFISSISVFTIRRIFCLNIFSFLSDTSFLYNKYISTLGFLILVIGLFTEIILKHGESIRLNAEVKNNEITLLTIAENIKDLILEVDLNGKITFVNEAVISSLGYSRAELIGFRFSDLIVDEAIKFYDKDKKAFYTEQKLRCKKGNILITETVINDIVDPRSNIMGKLISARDCSFREQLENLKIKYNEVKELEVLRTQFFANLSHEIRTPINIIFSCFQLLENKSSDVNSDLLTSYNKYSSTIKQNCYRLLRLVNNLIDITKIDSGYMKISFSNVNIVNLIENITLSIVPYVESKNLNVVFDTLVEELYIRCDADSIERIMLNLLANAVKFTKPNGNILVSIEANDKFVTIKVKDDGIGIPKEFKESIFDRFTQSNKSLSREKEGSGIGLALVKSLVELHEGSITLNSDNKSAKGSEFIIKLPNIQIENNPTVSKPSNSTIEKVSIEFSDIYDLT